jgi:hypothetical protein
VQTVVSAPSRLTDRRQVERSIEDAQQQRIANQIEKLLKQSESIEHNRARRDEEDDKRRAARFARNDLREAKTEVRYALTEERRAKVALKRPIYVLWDYLYIRWQKKGFDPEGVQVGFSQMKGHLAKRCPKKTHLDRSGFSDRYIGDLIEEMRLRQALEIRKRGRQARMYLPRLNGVLRGSDRATLRLLEAARRGSLTGSTKHP